MNPIKETTLEINLKALAHNYTYLRSHIANSVKFMGVIKAYAYGSESLVIAQKLIALGADRLAVSYSYEGVELRQSGINQPILVFHPQPMHFEDIIKHKLTPTLYSMRTLEAFIKVAESQSLKAYPVHINLNTGMNRLGFNQEDLETVKAKLKHTETIKVEGLYSHFAASEDPKEREFTQSQIKRFKHMTSYLSEDLSEKPILHLCNTSGILNYPEAHFDMVRAGIGLYGYGNSQSADEALHPVATLKTPITEIHHLKKGETVSYNRRFIAQRESKIAVLALGYADGLYRAYGNANGSVLIHSKKAPIVGNICMGITMVDVTDIPCQEGEEVILFGADFPATINAGKINTISYELITAVSQRVKRKVVSE